MLKKILIILIILSSMKFYRFVFIPEVIISGSEWIGIALLLALNILYLVYSREEPMKKHFAFPVLLVFISVFISMFGSYLFQDQPFLTTAYGQRVIYFYLIYFLLHHMKIEREFLTKTIVWFGVTYIVLHFLQYFLYPVQIINTKIFVDRGTVRIALSGSGYLVISYFIWLYLAFRNFKIRYVVFLLLALSIFILMGTRQVIASVVLLTMLFIFQTRLIKSKLLLIVLVGVALIPLYFLFQDIFIAMYEVTQEQSQNTEGNIRFRAAKFFLTEFFPNKLSYFTGNGAAGSSMYGLRLLRYSNEYGYYLTDIGLIGEYVRYGIIYVIAIFAILIKVFLKKLPEELMFIKYNFLGIVLTLVTGSGAFGSSSTNILINCMLLYLIDYYVDERNQLNKPIVEPAYTGG